MSAPERMFWNMDGNEDAAINYVTTDGPATGARVSVEYVPVSVLAAKDAEIAALRAGKDGAYEERNRLVALLTSMFPSGRAWTDIPDWNPEWHGCVYIDLPWGQASWHFHDSQAHLFEHLPPYQGEWDGHTTEAKYESIAAAARNPCWPWDAELARLREPEWSRE